MLAGVIHSFQHPFAFNREDLYISGLKSTMENNFPFGFGLANFLIQTEKCSCIQITSSHSRFGHDAISHVGGCQWPLFWFILT